MLFSLTNIKKCWASHHHSYECLCHHVQYMRYYETPSCPNNFLLNALCLVLQSQLSKWIVLCYHPAIFLTYHAMSITSNQVANANIYIDTEAELQMIIGLRVFQHTDQITQRTVDAQKARVQH